MWCELVCVGVGGGGGGGAGEASLDDWTNGGLSDVFSQMVWFSFYRELVLF